MLSKLKTLGGNTTGLRKHLSSRHRHLKQQKDFIEKIVEQHEEENLKKRKANSCFPGVPNDEPVSKQPKIQLNSVKHRTTYRRQVESKGDEILQKVMVIKKKGVVNHYIDLVAGTTDNWTS